MNSFDDMFLNHIPPQIFVMVDSVELFLVGQGLLLVTFLAMVGLFLLLLFIRSNAGPS